MDNDIVLTILSNLVRIGTVSAVDIVGKKARVIYKDKGITSGWLSVLQLGGAAVSISEAGEHTHSITDSFTGGGTASNDGNHQHNASVGTWLPTINQQVLVIYLPVFNGDGFILGAI